MNAADRPPIDDGDINTTRSSNEPVGPQTIQAPESVQSNPPVEQPCAICGQETAIGNQLHSARRSISDLDGRDMFVCANCDEAARATRGGERLSDDDLRNFVRSASLAAIAWSSG